LAAFKKNLFRYLEKFSEEELKQFKRYLQSPFFKIESRDRVLKLFEYLQKFHPNYDDPKLENDTLGKKLKFTNIKNIKSTLLECAEQFLNLNFYHSDQFEHYHQYISNYALVIKDISPEKEKSIESSIENYKHQDFYKPLDYLQLHEINILNHVVLNANRVKRTNLHMSAAISNLTHFFLYQNIKNLIAFDSLKDLVNIDANVAFTRKLLMGISDIDNLEDPQIKAGYRMWQAMNSEDLDETSTLFYEMKELVLKDWKSIEPYFQNDIYVTMNNIASKLFFRGKLEFKAELFENHKFWIEKGVHQLFENIHCQMFYATVRSACDVKEFDWASDFINEHESYITETEKEDTLEICDVVIMFFKADFEGALQKLNTINFLNSPLSFACKVIELQCLYEMKDEYRLDTYSKNFENFIRRHKDASEENKVGHINFVKSLAKIVKANYHSEASKLQKLRTAIKSESNLFYRSWLLDKLSVIAT